MITEYDDDLAAERAYVASLYARLDVLRARTSGRLSNVLAAASGTAQWRSERDALARTYEDRLAGLMVGDLPLCFGRLDLTDGTRYHVGRLALSTDDHEPLLVDWRAPAAEPFYQATPRDHRGVIRRRHLLTKGREVLGIDDEVFDLDSLSEDDREGLRGDAALLAALSKSRTGRMGDIVATIQAEQDQVIRAELPGVLVVEGGPGTGKTAVALHRAAYLLYTFRRRLAGTGVLIVGPNNVFLRYIQQVLPSLGETGAVLVTPGELFPGVSARRSEPHDVARVKNDLRMVGVLRRALEDRQRVPREYLSIPFEGEDLRLTRARALKIRASGRRGGRPHNHSRQRVESMVLDVLMPQIPVRGDVDSREDPEFVRRRLQNSRPFREAMEFLWPELSPQEFLNDLFGFPALIRSAGAPLTGAGLTARDQELLFRERRPDPAHVDWSIEDVPLLDEAAQILGDVPTHRAGRTRARDRRRRRELAFAEETLRNLDLSMPIDANRLAGRYRPEDAIEALAERARADRTWAFGHVIVDEAQELSPMAWRVVFRRVPTRSMTIVGDLAQAGVPWAPRTWDELLDQYAKGRWRRTGLSVNYRTPSEIMDVAAAVLAEADPAVEPPVAMRDAGLEPFVVSGPAPLDGVVTDAVRRELAAIGDGRLAVISSQAQRDGLEATLRAALPEALAGGVLDSSVAVLSVRDAKGLEFDSVLIVEPGAIAEESERGLHDLYVALTRSTRRLVLVHSGELRPEVLAAAVRDRS